MIPIPTFDTVRVGEGDQSNAAIVGSPVHRRITIRGIRENVTGLNVEPATDVFDGAVSAGSLIVQQDSNVVATSVAAKALVYAKIHLEHDADKTIDRCFAIHIAGKGSANLAIAEGDLPQGPTNGNWDAAATLEDAVQTLSEPLTQNLFASSAIPAEVRSRGSVQSTAILFKGVPAIWNKQSHLIGVIRAFDPPGPSGNDPPARVIAYLR